MAVYCLMYVVNKSCLKERGIQFLQTNVHFEICAKLLCQPV